MPASVEGEFSNGRGFETKVWPGDVTAVNQEMADSSYVSLVFACDRRDLATDVFVCEGLARVLNEAELSSWQESSMPLQARKITQVGHLEGVGLAAEDFGWEEHDSPISFVTVVHVSMANDKPNPKI